jgi:hypothetical protein
MALLLVVSLLYLCTSPGLRCMVLMVARALRRLHSCLLVMLLQCRQGVADVMEHRAHRGLTLVLLWTLWVLGV